VLLGGIVGTTGLASACGSGDGAGTIGGRMKSAAMKGRVGWTLHRPAGTRTGDRLPVVVSLHGRGGSHSTSFTQLHLDRVVDDLHRAGGPAIAVAAVDGGDHGYWHRRTDGTDPGAMVAREFVPLLRRRGFDTSRLGLFGWSMGGYGALLLTGKGLLRPRAVAVSSPALFTSAGATAAGAFDSAADFDRNDVYAHPEWDRGIPTRIDIGDRDPFVTATRDYMARLRLAPAGGVHPGSHDADFWRHWAPAQFDFLARHL
jgi:dienelactone hydrolase